MYQKAAQRREHVRSVEKHMLRLSILTAFLFSGPRLLRLSQPLTSQRTILHPDPGTSQQTRATLPARLRYTAMLRRYSMGFYQSRFGRKAAITLYRATAFMTTAIAFAIFFVKMVWRSDQCIIWLATKKINHQVFAQLWYIVMRFVWRLNALVQDFITWLHFPNFWKADFLRCQISLKLNHNLCRHVQKLGFRKERWAAAGHNFFQGTIYFQNFA